MPKAKKPVVATQEDINQLTELLNDKIKETQYKSETAVQEAEKRLQDVIKRAENMRLSKEAEMVASITQARADSRSYSEECVKSFNDQLLPLVTKLEKDIIASNNHFSNSIQTLDSSMRAHLAEEMGAVCEKFDQELGGLREDFNGGMLQWAKDAADSLVEQRREIDAVTEDLQKQVDAAADHIRTVGATKVELEAAVADQRRADEKEQDRVNLQHAEIYVQLGMLKDDLREAVAKAANDSNRFAREAASGLARLTDHAKERLEKLDTETVKLFDSMSVVESFTTKRVEWVIQNASKKFRIDWGSSGTKLHTGWFSPKFDAAGCFGLQLELQMFRVTEAELAGKEGLGNLAAFLWACKGYSVVFKIYIGNKSMTLEKTFNGRVPYGTPRLCWLHEQINKEDDTLRVGVEILESTREVEHPIKPPPIPPLPPSGDYSSADAVSAAREAAKHAAEGSLFFKRHITNRLLEQVHKEVEVMRSRMVRKIEWRVQHASMLRICFPKDEAICSPHFNAAGIERIQFVLYPSGYDSATEGFCSLYLHGPVGATLRCRLCIGKQMREVFHSFDDTGAFGRTNFCNWESVIEEGDFASVRLEIEEAQQDVRAAMSHQGVVAGDQRTIGQLNGDDAPIESVVKLTRTPGNRHTPPGSAGPGLEEQMVLPSLWTAKPVGEAPEGFRKFEELNDLKPNPRPSTAGDPTARLASAARPSSAVSNTGGLRRNASLPGRPRSGARPRTPCLA